MRPRTRLLIAVSLLLASCSDVSFVDEVTIVNQTEYPAHVEVTDQNRDGWLGLTVVDAHSTSAVAETIDQGEVWIFRFDYVGKHHELVEVSRRELERNDWTVEVPATFEQQLRARGVIRPRGRKGGLLSCKLLDRSRRCSRFSLQCAGLFRSIKSRDRTT